MHCLYCIHVAFLNTWNVNINVQSNYQLFMATIYFKGLLIRTCLKTNLPISMLNRFIMINHSKKIISMATANYKTQKESKLNESVCLAWNKSCLRNLNIPTLCTFSNNRDLNKHTKWFIVTYIHHNWKGSNTFLEIRET